MIKTRNIERIVVFRALFLGDLLCSLPALQALRTAFPRAEITLIGLPWAHDLVDRVGCIDHLDPFCGYPGILEVPYVAETTDAFVTAARAMKYGLAIQMHGDGNISNGFVADLGAQLSLGYRNGEDRRLDIALPYQREEHEVLRWLRLMSALGIPADHTPVELSISAAETD